MTEIPYLRREGPSRSLLKQLRGGVPAPRAWRRVGRDRQRTGEPLPPDDLSAAAQHHPVHARQPRLLEHVVGADEVVGQQPLEEVVVIGRRGEVNQHVDSLHRPARRRPGR